ncbi:hypothetical protein HPB50_026057 [Hyalomma asiaticum]|uniref:Uncharacterized protein n=1 Tax=Hyalomma asiaticum TaxID=266040 RepID=A0ACB7SL26_HYAAI|nr:hypothetical protein HPB50_026057 [Hyalomma asiaticum]
MHHQHRREEAHHKGRDFNAPHTGWGYSYVFPKGGNLWLDSQQEGITLIPKPSTPTRAGTSSTKDSTPDITFTRNTSATTWQITIEDLGSDHYIIAIRVQGGPRKHTGRQFKMVDWIKFRKSRHNQVQRIDDIEHWTCTHKQDANNATQIVPPEEHTLKRSIAGSSTSGRQNNSSKRGGGQVIQQNPQDTHSAPQ